MERKPQSSDKYPSLHEPVLYEYEPTSIPAIPTVNSSFSSSSSSKLKINVEGMNKFYEMPLKEGHTVKRVQELASQKLTVPAGREVIVRKTDGTLLDPAVLLSTLHISEVDVKIVDIEERKGPISDMMPTKDPQTRDFKTSKFSNPADLLTVSKVILESDKLEAKAKEELSQAFETARNLDMAILLDTTGSMDHIVEAKNVCLEIIAKISADTTI
jgi:hypothetical protein